MSDAPGDLLACFSLDKFYIICAFLFYFSLYNVYPSTQKFNLFVMDLGTNKRIKRSTDGHTLLKRCKNVSKN